MKRPIEVVGENKVLTNLLGNGPCIYLDPTDHVQALIMEHGFWEKWNTNVFLKLIEPGMTVLDIGAHCGYFTLLAAMKVGPTGKVHAFEPNPLNYENFEKSLMINKYQHVQLHKVALTDKDGETTLYVPRSMTGGASIYHNGAEDICEITVKTVNFQTYFPRQKVDVIKIDIEGSEPFIIEGLCQLIDYNGAMEIIMEYCPYMWKASVDDPRVILQKFADRNFSFDIIQRKDGTIVPTTLDQLVAYAGIPHLDVKLGRR